MIEFPTCNKSKTPFTLLSPYTHQTLSLITTLIGTCAPEIVTVTPPSAEVASTSVLVSCSWSSFTFTPTCAAPILSNECARHDARQ